MWKKVLAGVLVVVLMAGLTAAAGGAWYMFFRETPTRVVEGAVQDARERDAEQFKQRFSVASRRALEGSWTGDTVGQSGSWNAMMEGILESNGAPPRLIKEEIVGERATVRVELGSRKRTIFLIRDEGRWWIDVLSGIDEGLSDEARRAQAATTADPEQAKKEKELLTEPKRDGWWKKSDK